MSETTPTHVLPGLVAGSHPPEGEAPVEKRVYFEVFGCQMNKLDAELMLAALMEHGYVLTSDPDRAGVILYNTCAVRQHAEDRVFSNLGRLRLRKRRHPDLVIGLMGCIAQHAGKDVLRRFPHVDIVCGTAEFLRLPQLIETARQKGPVVAIDLAQEVKHSARRNLGPRPAQAYVSVMRGCDQTCSFCIVPLTRGPEVSRPVAEVVDEVKALAGEGVLEVTLLGQTVNSYGKRLSPGKRVGLHHLLHELEEVRGLERIRFITSHPRFMSEDLISAMASLEKVCGYLHLPVQSGSDAVLRRMRRGHTAGHYRRIIERCRARIRDFTVATDVIVGFPGETEEEFGETRRLLEDLRFQGAFIFKYSPRPGTRAAVIPDDVPEETKRERNADLLEVQERIGEELRRGRIGGVEEVLVEGTSKNDPRRLTGRNRAFDIVVFPGKEEEGLTGKLVKVRITGATALTLSGERIQG